MPSVVTTAGTITCSHKGTATLTPGQSKLTVGGKPVVVATDVAKAPISKCTNNSAGQTPCPTTVPAVSGLATALAVDGVQVLTDKAAGAPTASVPPGAWSVTEAGQTFLSSI